MSAGERKGQALKHQEDGTQFLRVRERAALFDEPGLGKSKQLIDAIVGLEGAFQHFQVFGDFALRHAQVQ